MISDPFRVNYCSLDHSTQFTGLVESFTSAVRLSIVGVHASTVQAESLGISVGLSDMGGCGGGGEYMDIGCQSKTVVVSMFLILPSVGKIMYSSTMYTQTIFCPYVSLLLGVKYITGNLKIWYF